MNRLVSVIDLDMPNRIKNHTTELLGFITSALGVITANQEQVEWWLRCLASAIAIVAGCASLYAFIKNQRKNEKAMAVTALMGAASDPTLTEAERERYRKLLGMVLNNKTIRPEDLDS